MSRKEAIIEELIETRINGNSIRSNDTYEKMIKRITFQDILRYANNNDYKWSIEDIGRNQKIDLINSIVNNLD